jgi:hypothetical protein
VVQGAQGVGRPGLQLRRSAHPGPSPAMSRSPHIEAWPGSGCSLRGAQLDRVSSTRLRVASRSVHGRHGTPPDRVGVACGRTPHPPVIGRRAGNLSLPGRGGLPAGCIRDGVCGSPLLAKVPNLGCASRRLHPFAPDATHSARLEQCFPRLRRFPRSPCLSLHIPDRFRRRTPRNRRMRGTGAPLRPASRAALHRRDC